jgi:hypothetical protein
MKVSYRVDLKIPWLPRCVQIDDDLFVVKAELLEGDMRSVGPGASVVGVEGDFWGRHGAVLCSGMVRSLTTQECMNSSIYIGKTTIEI